MPLLYSFCAAVLCVYGYIFHSITRLFVVRHHRFQWMCAHLSILNVKLFPYWSHIFTELCVYLLRLRIAYLVGVMSYTWRRICNLHANGEGNGAFGFQSPVCPLHKGYIVLERHFWIIKSIYISEAKLKDFIIRGIDTVWNSLWVWLYTYPIRLNSIQFTFNDFISVQEINWDEYEMQHCAWCGNFSLIIMQICSVCSQGNALD